MNHVYTINGRTCGFNISEPITFRAAIYKGEITPVFPYKTVTIGTQTWMAENLSEDDGGDGITIVNNVTANGVNMGTQYFYTQAAAIRIAETISGWHLPTTAELDTLVTNTGNLTVNLISSTGWNSINGNDMYEFTAWPVGQVVNGSHNNAGTECHFWGGDSNNYRLLLNPTYRTSPQVSSESPSKGYSVRLIKDAS